MGYKFMEKVYKLKYLAFGNREDESKYAGKSSADSTCDNLFLQFRFQPIQPPKDARDPPICEQGPSLPADPPEASVIMAARC